MSSLATLLLLGGAGFVAWQAMKPGGWLDTGGISGGTVTGGGQPAPTGVQPAPGTPLTPSTAPAMVSTLPAPSGGTTAATVPGSAWPATTGGITGWLDPVVTTPAEPGTLDPVAPADAGMVTTAPAVIRPASVITNPPPTVWPATDAPGSALSFTEQQALIRAMWSRLSSGPLPVPRVPFWGMPFSPSAGVTFYQLPSGVVLQEDPFHQWTDWANPNGLQANVISRPVTGPLATPPSVPVIPFGAQWIVPLNGVPTLCQYQQQAATPRVITDSTGKVLGTAWSPLAQGIAVTDWALPFIDTRWHVGGIKWNPDRTWNSSALRTPGFTALRSDLCSGPSIDDPLAQDDDLVTVYLIKLWGFFFANHHTMRAESYPWDSPLITDAARALAPTSVRPVVFP